jgi:serine/threonine protein kinase
VSDPRVRRVTIMSKLDVRTQGDRSRQISFTSDPQLGIRNKKHVTIWARERFLAENVCTNSGDLRVVKQVLRKPASLGNCLSELRAMSRLSKENSLLVQFIGWFSLNEHIYFAMEYCPLADIPHCFQYPLSETITRNIGNQKLEGLSKLHEIKIIYRDIKPQNILVQQNDPIWVKICHFGISNVRSMAKPNYYYYLH